MSYLGRVLAPDERIVHRTRRHVIVLARTMGAALLIVAAGVALALYLGPRSDETGPLATCGGLGLALLGAVAAFPAWVRWRTEQYVVTDRRVIQLEGVFRKRVLDSSLEKVNDVLVAQSVAGRLFGYGTIEILTASEHGINRLETLPDPLGFKHAMLAARSRTPVPEARTSAPPAPEPAGAAARLHELEEMKRRALISEEEYRAKRRQILDGL